MRSAHKEAQRTNSKRRRTGRVEAVAPQVAGLAVAGDVREPVLLRVIEDLVEGSVRIPEVHLRSLCRCVSAALGGARVDPNSVLRTWGYLAANALVLAASFELKPVTTPFSTYRTLSGFSSICENDGPR